MLMALGLFVFELRSAPVDRVTRQTVQRWSQQDRAGAPESAQYLGPGSDTITLDGLLMPELTQGRTALDTLRRMARQGKAWILLDGQGRYQGTWYIEQVSERATHLLDDGTPRRIDFTVDLRRYFDREGAVLGQLPDSR